ASANASLLRHPRPTPAPPQRRPRPRATQQVALPFTTPSGAPAEGAPAERCHAQRRAFSAFVACVESHRRAAALSYSALAAAVGAAPSTLAGLFNGHITKTHRVDAEALGRALGLGGASRRRLLRLGQAAGVFSLPVRCRRARPPRGDFLALEHA